MRRTDRYIQFGARRRPPGARPGRAARRGWRATLAERTGVILGSGLGGVETLFDNVLVMAERGPDRISPFFIPMGIANVGAGPGRDQLRDARAELRDRVRLRHRRPRHRRGWETIRRGDADVMIAGGAEAAVHEALVGGFAR